MPHELRFEIQHIRFDEHYQPDNHTRLTTNFANLARGEQRQANLTHALYMINQRFNTLAHWDNPRGERYQLELDIITAQLNVADLVSVLPPYDRLEQHTGSQAVLPLIEMLNAMIVDRHTGQRLPGVLGHNFSSYVRDYDFSVLLPQLQGAEPPTDFGELHGRLFKAFIHSAAYASLTDKLPLICLSVSTSKTYTQTANYHPVLGVEYRQDAYSLTDQYFGKMGLTVRYFMPKGSVAPLAFYFMGDLLADYSNLELISVISTMETFQKIYRPEIYNANAVAGQIYQPSLQQFNYSVTRIAYDRQERSQLAVQQGLWIEQHLIQPYQHVLSQWALSA